MTPALIIQLVCALIGQTPEIVKLVGELFAKIHSDGRQTPSDSELQALKGQAPDVHAVFAVHGYDYSQPVPPGQDSPGV
jgi:hypothetical protein